MRKPVLLILIYGILTGTVAAEIQADFSGFATLTAGYNSSSEVGFKPNSLNNAETDWSILRDSNLGLQLNIGFSSQWDSVLQIVAQDRANTTFENFVETAFIRFRPNRNWSIRAGRISSDFYLLSEYPSVGSAYLWQRPPQEFYSSASTLGNFDGIDVEFSDNINDGFFRIKLATGSTSPKFSSIGFKSEIEFENMFTLSAFYQKGNFIVRGSHTLIDITEHRIENLSALIDGLNALPDIFWEKASVIAEGLNPHGKEATYTAFGVTFENDKWILQTEVGRTVSNWLFAPDTLSGYLSLAYKFNNVALFSTISGAKKIESDVDFGSIFTPPGLPDDVTNSILQLNAAVTGIVLGTVNHQNSKSVGAKWFATDILTIKAQIDHFKIYPNGGVLWEYENTAQTALEHSINLFSVSVSTVF